MVTNKTTIVFSGITPKEFRDIKVKWLKANKNLLDYDLKLVNSAELGKYIYKNFQNNPNKVIVVTDIDVSHYNFSKPSELENRLETIKNRFSIFDMIKIKTIVYSDNKMSEIFDGLPIIKKNEILKLYDVINKYKSTKIKKLNIVNLLKHLLNTNNHKNHISKDAIKHILGAIDKRTFDLSNKKKLTNKEKVELYLSLQKKQLDKELKIAAKNGDYSKKQMNELLDKYKKITDQYNAMHHGSENEAAKVIEHFYPKKEKAQVKSKTKKPIFRKPIK